MRQEVRVGNWSESVNVITPVGEIYDAAANDSDKSWVVPGNEMWRINHAYVSYAATATVGNRQLTLRVKNAAGNTVIEFVAGAVQAALVTRQYAFMQGITRETTFTNNTLQVSIAEDLWLLPGYTLQILDSAAIDAAADDMTVAVSYAKYVV